MISLGDMVTHEGRNGKIVGIARVEFMPTRYLIWFGGTRYSIWVELQ
jgi:hypothetical protein